MWGSDQQTPSAVEGEILRQQQIYLLHQIPTIAGVNLMNGALVTGLFYEHAHATAILLWFLVLFGISALQTQAYLKLRKAPAPKTVSGRSMRRSIIMSTILGALWGGICLIIETPSVPLQMFLAVVIAGMTAGTTSILNPLPSICSPFVIAALAPLIVRMGLEGQPLHLTVAVLAIVFGVALIQGSRRAYKQFSGMIKLSHELQEAKADLVDALESTHDAFALYDGRGHIAIANSRFSSWFPDAASHGAPSTGEAHSQIGTRWVQGSVSPTARGGHVAVYTDITALKERETELIAATQEAHEANRAKTEFLANMSHELRTPLNAVLGFTELMHGEVFGPLGSPKYSEYCKDIHNSANHLLAIITDILDLSKIESSKYEVQPEPVEIRDTLQWVASLCQHQPKTAHRKPIEVEVSDDFGPIMADPRAIKQILLNLANNALKFTPDGGSVGARAIINACGEPQITVWDTGIGIPADKLDWVRKPFHQVEGAFQRKFQGTGLGLSISEALIKLHGGRLELSSSVGKGTSVTIVFSANAHLKAAEPRRAAAGA